jgi:prepilin-type N-terminal cleavage/methylation domain-containing protein
MKRSAFTLIELLVVIAIIALLAAMLIVAVNRAKESARRAQCVSRQRDLAAAMIAYNNANDGLPGYLNQLGNAPIHSWAIAVFQMIGETKRYDILMKSKPTSDEQKQQNQALVSVPALLCPSNDSREGSPLDYVVNCGPITNNNAIDDEVILALSLFRDRRFPLNQTNKKVKLEEIPDGTSNTILLSENVDAGEWWSGTGSVDDGSGTKSWHNWTPIAGASPPIRDAFAERNLGFVWSPQRDFTPNFSVQPAQGPRPSSKHPGTIVAAFADGTAKPINDDISIVEWLKAVCPDDEKAKKPTNEGGLGWSVPGW